MLYALVQSKLIANWLDANGMLWLVRLMYELEFRAFAAVVVAFALVCIAAPPTIRWLRRQKIGDIARFDQAELDRINSGKANTPTMGGLFLCGSVLVTTLLLADVGGNRYVHLGIVVLIWLAIVGGTDDWLKLTANRRKPGSRTGLFAWEKLLFQAGIGLIAGLFLYQHQLGRTPDALVLNLPFQRTYENIRISEAIIQPPPLNPSVLVVGGLLYVLVAAFLITLTSNAVNLTDGMDGLAGGTVLMAALSMMVLCAIAASPEHAYRLLVPHVPDARELMVLSGAMAGACLAFLWFNCNPARVFMGDTGSLPLGGLLAFIAIAVRQEFLLLVIGGVFFAEAASVILQVGWFKWTRGGRLFRCAPIHHHFHLLGWTEQQVVTRFWIVGVLLSFIAIVSLKLR
ncbi:MAG TPA: phospho-N-acetylmuramoyl-pentapeptide-transferase [Phycisphaerales bacterium]|nr:phospho-N-acetylmuramoyl-pentapeptide-transferase [Phycisphaerales bacterium]HMP36583.1 phospho-N-acetylmuramoyl-pentapeptide-transferase [Phycisphaerales bacterium]